MWRVCEDPRLTFETRIRGAILLASILRFLSSKAAQPLGTNQQFEGHRMYLSWSNPGEKAVSRLHIRSGGHCVVV